MAADITAMLTIARRDLRRRGPAVRVRLLMYGLAWLPPLVLLFVLFPPVDPGLQLRIDRDEAPKVVRSLATFVGLNEASHYLLTVLTLLTLLLVDETLLRLLNRCPIRERWSWLWVGGVAAAGLAGWVVLVWGLGSV